MLSPSAIYASSINTRKTRNAFALSENRITYRAAPKLKFSIPTLNPHYYTVAKCGMWRRAIPRLFSYLLTNACVESCVFTGLP